MELDARQVEQAGAATAAAPKRAFAGTVAGGALADAGSARPADADKPYSMRTRLVIWTVAALAPWLLGFALLTGILSD